MRRSRTVPRRLAGLPIALAAILAPAAGPLAPAAARAERAPAAFRIVPGAYDKKDAARPAGDDGPAAGRVTFKGLSVVVEHLDPAARAAFVRSIDPQHADPFAAPPGRPEFYNAFLVGFENHAAEDATFQPGNVVLVTDRGEQQFPIDLTDLYRAAALGEVNDPEALMRRIEPLIFDASTTIPPGRRLSRLLVFGPLPRKWRELRLLFSFLHVGAETDSVSLTFHRKIVGG